jgi:hypothetical protein
MQFFKSISRFSESSFIDLDCLIFNCKCKNFFLILGFAKAFVSIYALFWQNLLRLFQYL